ncbi:MAG: four helix bundle protein [Alphaproteobacteria bacterium]|nr:four helix bundle protein [Alphaproteobacteria bacterium]
MSSYKDLEVWQKSIVLVKTIYLLAEAFPAKERFRLTDQMCRVAVSIPSNIAEGSAKKSDKEFMRYLAIALGSLAELKTQLIISVELAYVKPAHADAIEKDMDSLGKQLQALYSSIKRRVE